MDPNNPVIKLCAEGMQAELQGRFGDAHDLFMKAWEASTNDFEACVAAHYMARHQESPQETLHWNQEALARAKAVGDERVRSFYPSLYLNLGHSYEVLGDPVEARRYYGLADERSADLEAGPYGDMVKKGIARALDRIGSNEA
jgi:tetratricopeptide (TPR) repeat protein